MKHQRPRDQAKLERRRKTWDLFGFVYFDQPHRLFKRHWLKDNCSMCRYERTVKRLEKKRARAEGIRIVRMAVTSMHK